MASRISALPSREGACTNDCHGETMGHTNLSASDHRNSNTVISLRDVIVETVPKVVLEYSSPSVYVALLCFAAAWLWLRLLFGVMRRLFALSDDPDAWLECLAHSPHKNLILPPNCILSADKSGNRALRLAQGVKQVVARRFRRADVLSGKILVPSALPASCTPLVCFVNKMSGGNQGTQALANLRPLLNPAQIFDVHNCDSVAVLRAFSVLPRLRVLVAGGDGTVAAIIESSLSLDLDKRPPIAILPLGTGNDLARTLGWGGTADTDNLAACLLDVCNAVPQSLISSQKLDRWKFTAYRDAGPSTSGSASSEANKAIMREKVFMNYFGMGIDAIIAMKFDSARKSNPEHFDSQLRNKIWYAFFGWKAMLGQDYHFINRRLSVKIDGKEAAIPDESQGVILININSFAGGSRLWQPTGEHREQNHNDELVEVVSVDGPLHLGQIKTGISNGLNLGQCKRFEVRFFQKTHVQFDGEPELLPPCRATVAHAGQALMLCNRDHVSRFKQLEAAPKDDAIDFDEVVVRVLKEAQQSGTIDARQARALKKSFGVHLKRDH